MYQKVASSPYKDIPFVTALPANPSNGDIIVFTDSLSAPTYAWTLKYMAAKSSNKWLFMGGPPIEAEVATQETCSSTTLVALTTPGPTVTIPVAGDYFVTIEAGLTAAAVRRGFFSYSIAGSTASAAADECEGSVSVASEYNVHTRMKKKTGLAAAAALTMLYSEAGGSLDYYNRRIAALPIAVGG